MPLLAHLVQLEPAGARESPLVLGRGLGQRAARRPTQTTRITTAVCRTGDSAYDSATTSEQEQALEPEPQERHLNIHFEPQIMAGVYANFANVSHSDYEFTITFARVDHDVDGDEVPGVAVVARQPLAALHAPADRRDAGQLLEVVDPRGHQDLPEYDGD